jgi:signal transduction histidine kinase
MRRKEISFVRTEQQIINNDMSQWVEHIVTVGQNDEYGNPIKLVGVSMDITERKNMENDLIKAKEDAEESNRLKSAFLANMSHEIRTPLNAIIGFSTLVASTQDDEDKQQYLSIVQENNNQLLQIIEDILDLSKIEAGSMDYNIKEVDLFYLFKDLERSACLRNTNDSVIISFEEDLSPKLIMETDKNRIAQVVNNLINNALKFTVQGSIVFGYRKEEKQVYFYVKDTGCGIPKDKLNFVFGRFVKLNSFAKGTGLGLSICESIVSHLGGTIGVDSKEGVGSDFWFRLPLSC